MDNSENLTSTEVRNFLVRRLGEKEADEIMEYIENETERRVLEKGEETRLEIERWRNEISQHFATKEEAAALQTRLVKRVSAVEGTIILWGFVFGLH